MSVRKTRLRRRKDRALAVTNLRDSPEIILSEDDVPEVYFVREPEGTILRRLGGEGSHD